jgi:ATP-dependent RNA helicase SUPV3L1/SUV3
MEQILNPRGVSDSGPLCSALNPLLNLPSREGTFPLDGAPGLAQVKGSKRLTFSMPPHRNVTAVLGPTNTGKTHLAVERMLGHGGGMIGLPLRLLAREIYDRVRLRAGDAAVALVTGEEKIIPASPRYWVATVEAMPADIDVPFLAIDEVQLAADFERGHIFTDRVLHRRGREETMLLGAGTMRPILERLLPGTSFVSRPRFSRLSYAGQKKITRLPGRSAVVAFSAEMVYAVAELIRRQRGGAAVVLGALSPRTRNAQVALYQSGDVDYIVATDAIGMGLNMDVDHVAFAATRKFDGFQYRSLNPGELGQVAGRAGRYLNDGTFGVTGEADPFDAETVERLETHHFDSVRVLQWRNRDLDFASLDRLRMSLNALPRLDGLTRAQSGPDVTALEAIARDGEVAPLAVSPRDVERLWEVCQIPDYRNISNSEHAGLVARVFQFLQTGSGYIDEDWFARQLRHCDKAEGDLDTLSNRIAHIRTWTFVANRVDWLKTPLYWQGRAREIEDKLSDALHERLTQRFIDRRTSVLMRRLAQKEELMSTVEEDGAIRVEGEYVGRIRGFIFLPDGVGETAEARTLKAAALQAVASEIMARAKAVAVSSDTDLKLARDGQIVWNHATVGRVEAGASLLKPRAVVLAGDQLTGPEREEVQARLQKFLDRHVATLLEPLVKLEEGEGLDGIAKGIAFRIAEHLGVLPRETVAADVRALSQEDRARLRALGVRFGAYHLFVPVLLKPAATELRLLLWALQLQKEGKLDLADLPVPPGQGLTSAPFDRSTPRGFYGVCGYRICGTRVVRIDMVERLADVIRDRVFWRPRFPDEPRPSGSVEGGGFTIVADMMSLVGCSGEEFQGIIRSLDFRMQPRKIRRPVAPAAEAASADVTAKPAGEEVIAPSPAITAVADATEPDSPPPAGEETTPAVAETVAGVSEDAAPEGLVENADTTATAATDPAAAAAVEPADVPVAAAAEASDAVPAPETAMEPAMEEVEIEVWWPKDTGPFRHRVEKPQAARHRHGAPAKAGGEAGSETGSGETSAEAVAAPRHRRSRRHGDRRPAGEDISQAAKTGHQEAGEERRSRRDDRKPRPEERKPRSERAEKPVDPNSPFAVLLELKARMAANKG